MRFGPLCALALLVGVLSAPASAEDAARLNGLMRDYSVPVVALAEIDAAGRVDRTLLSSDGRTVRSDADLFSAGSISKVVAAFAALRLVEARQFDIDRPIDVHGWSLPPTAKGVTARMLLAHRGGANISSYPGWTAPHALPDIIASLNGATNGAGPAAFSSPPNERFAYSGAGFSIVQLALQEAAEESYARLVETQVFEPLGMRSATFEPPTDRVVAPADDQGQRIAPRIFAEQAAAGLYLSLDDLIRLARGLKDPSPILSAASVAEMRKASSRPLPLNELQIVLSQAMEPDLSRLRATSSYGLGLQIFRLRNDRLVVGHGGSTIGARAMMYVAPETGESIMGFAVGENGQAILADALCRWRHRVGGEHGTPRCLKLAQPLLVRAYRSGGFEGLSAEFEALYASNAYNMHDGVLLDVLSKVGDDASFSDAQRRHLLHRNWRAFPRSAATAAEMARLLVRQDQAEQARRWARRAMRLQPHEPDFDDLIAVAR